MPYGTFHGGSQVSFLNSVMQTKMYYMIYFTEAAEFLFSALHDICYMMYFSAALSSTF